MKKHIFSWMMGSVLAVLLCGCTGGVVSSNIPAGTASVPSDSKPVESSVQSSGPSEEPSEEEESREEESSAPQSSAEESSEPSEQESSRQEESSGEEASSGGNDTTEKKYLDNGLATVDIADQKVLYAGKSEKDRIFYIRTLNELSDFYSSYSVTFSLDSTDSGEVFNSAVSTMDDSFFETNELVITLQDYEKADGINVGDVYIADRSAYIDIYKSKPRAPDSTGYVLYLVTVAKADLAGLSPTVNILPAGSYLE